MSYILDALKKAEHQRDIGQVPGIGSEHQSTMTTRVGYWVYVLLFVLLINAGLLVYALWPEPASPTRPVSAPPAAGSAVPTPLPAVNPPAVASLVEKPAPPPVVSHQAPEVSAPPPVTLRPLPPLPEPTKSIPVETPGVSDSEADAALPVGEAPAPVVAAPAPAPAPRPNDNLPVWPQVSGELFREIGRGLRLDVHVYSQHPDERFILINMQKYNEGERLQEGPVVDEITPEGVILSFRGQRFRVRAQ